MDKAERGPPKIVQKIAEIIILAESGTSQRKKTEGFIPQAAQAHASRKRGIYKLFMVLESGRDLRERPVLGY